jgi:glucosyl-3-phosphoglycerate phosphatase
VSAARLVLWRHGRTGHNSTNRFQGQLDTQLDDVGRAQAEGAARVLAELAPAAIVSSDLARAHDTAQALARRTGLDVDTDPGLREVHVGAWQGLTHEEIVARWPEQFAEWRAGKDIRIEGGGELRSAVAERTVAAVHRHVDATPDGGLLVVTSHGAALRSGMVLLLGLPASAMRAFAAFRNAHWAVLERRSSGWVLVEYNLGPPSAIEGVEG